MRTSLETTTRAAVRALTQQGVRPTAEAVVAHVEAQLPSLDDAARAAVRRSAERMLALESVKQPATGPVANKTLHALGMKLAHKQLGDTTAKGHALAARLGFGAPDPGGAANAHARLRARFGEFIDRAPGIELLAFERGAVYRERGGDTWRPVPGAVTTGADYQPVPYVGEGVLKEAEKAARGEKTWAHKNELDSGELAALVARMKSHTGPIKVDASSGLPLNPLGRTGVSGRGESNLGPILAQDLFLSTQDPATGERYAVLIRRKDTGRWAMPGGIEDDKDKGARVPTAVREFFEETIPEDRQAEFLDVIADAFRSARQVFQGVCAREPRNTDHMWFETTVFRVDIPWELARALPLAGGDDASAAKLKKLTPALVASLHGDHPDFVMQALELA